MLWPALPAELKHYNQPLGKDQAGGVVVGLALHLIFPKTSARVRVKYPDHLLKLEPHCYPSQERIDPPFKYLNATGKQPETKRHVQQREAFSLGETQMIMLEDA